MRCSTYPFRCYSQATIQRRVQAVTLGDRSYVLRELLSTQDRLLLAHWHGKIRRLEHVMDVMGQLVAWGQLRSGGRQGSATLDALTGFAHQPGWQQPLLAYALRYSAHVVQEWQQFCEAFDKGVLREQGAQERDEVTLAQGKNLP